MNVLSQSSLLVAIVSFALGFAVMAKNPKNKLFLFFALVCTLVSGWALFFFLAQVWENQTHYKVHLFFHVWLAPAALLFVRAMVRSQSLGRIIFALSVLTSVVLTACLAFGIEKRAPQLLQFVYFAPVFVAVQTIQLMWMDYRARLRGRNIARRSLIYFGALLVLSLSVMDHVPAAGSIVPVVGNLALTVYLFFLGQAVTQQRFLNVGAAFSRFLVLLAMALTLTGVYSLLFSWIEGKFGLFLLNSFIVSLMLLLLLEPIQKSVGFLTRQLMTKKYRRLEETIRRAQRRLALTVDANALYRDILETLRSTVLPEWAALFVLRTDGTLYRRAQTLGREPEGSRAPFEMLSDHLLLQQCQRLRLKGELPILLDQILEADIDRSASSSQREQAVGLLEALRALEGNVLIPLFDGRRILAFVIVRAPTPPEPWGNNWGILPILYPYFEQAAMTLRNMEVYVRSREIERLAELGEMAAGLAHEIRNPLGAIKGAAQFLDPDRERPESKFLKVIVEEVDRLNRVVTQFLDFSKPSAVSFRSADASLLASRTVEFLQPSVRPGVVLRFEPSRTPARVKVAPEQIQQVILNLIQNSLNALASDPNRVGWVKVTVRVDDSGDNRQVWIEVEDNGPGISPENRKKIFIPFFTTRPSGTGLGLSICQKIIEAHRGRIEVSSEEGKYARFSVILPFVPGSGN